MTNRYIDVRLWEPFVAKPPKATVCADCGSIVLDRQLHDDFHDGYDQLVRHAARQVLAPHVAKEVSGAGYTAGGEHPCPDPSVHPAHGWRGFATSNGSSLHCPGLVLPSRTAQPRTAL